MEAMLNWLVNYWNEFCLWVSNQPTFVEIAFGIGLFYLVLQIAKAVLKFFIYIISGLFPARGRFKKSNQI